MSNATAVAPALTTHPSGDARFGSLDQTIAHYHNEPTSLIQVLHAAQQLFGYLSADVLRYIATALRLPVSHVYGVVTFYHFFTMVPRGKHQIMVCTGTTCHVRGSKTLLERLEQQLGIKEGETTKDNLFSLNSARCIGACALAPAIAIGDDVYGKLSPDKVPRFCQKDLKKYVEELSLHILDIAMNSLAAGAKTVDITVVEHARRDALDIRIRDDGAGMDATTLRRVLAAPISTKRSRKKAIGLGLALLRQTAEMCDGTFHIRSAPGAGTTVTATMKLSHVDRPPMGDLNTTILALCAANPGVDVRLHCLADRQQFHFSSKERDTQHEPGRTQEIERKGATTSCAA